MNVLPETETDQVGRRVDPDVGFIPIAYLSLSTDAHLAWPVTLLWFALVALFLDKGDLIADLVESWKQ